MKLKQILDPKFQEALRNLSAQPLPLTAAFKLKSIKAIIYQEYDKYKQCHQEALIRLADKDAAGQPLMESDGCTVKMSTANKDLLLKELSKLMEIDVVINRISVEEFGGIMISVDNLESLDPIFIT